jgi:hypothetical protein
MHSQVDHFKQPASMLLREFCLSTETELWQKKPLALSDILENPPKGPRLKKLLSIFTPFALLSQALATPIKQLFLYLKYSLLVNDDICQQ